MNPFIIATVRSSTGYATDGAGARTPTYATSSISIQRQSLQYNDLVQLDGLNIQGERRKVYANGFYAGVVRADDRGGDLLIFAEYPRGPLRAWRVVLVFESWPDWCSLALTLQNAASGSFVATGVTPLQVACPEVTASSLVVITLQSAVGTPDGLPTYTLQPGVGFTVTAAAGDLSTYNYLVVG